MGKIRVKTLGNEEEELKEKEEAQKRKEAKIAELKGAKKEEVEESEPETILAETAQEKKLEEPQAEVKEEKKTVKIKKDQKAFHSKVYDGLVAKVDPSKVYALTEALELLGKLQRGKFDETVELHLNTVSAGISGSIVLPHGTGKVTRVAIADDKIIAEVEKGAINFDILVATPAMMPKLAKVARVLGPRGLMPNPKNGTVTDNPEAVAKKYEGGQLNFKTEAKNPLLHLTVGKVSFGNDKLSQNINAMIAAVKKSNIVNVTLKSTMSPGIKIKF